MTEPNAQPALERYRLPMPGGGIEELDRLAVRDRIRRREIVDRTEMARAGTEEWKRAGDFPELARYFELLASGKAPEARVSITRHFEGMGERLVKGLAYPLGRGGILTILALALFSYVPFLGMFATPIASVYVLGIIRESANGETEMPGWFDTSDLTDVLITWLKTAAVTLIALLPVIAWILLWASPRRTSSLPKRCSGCSSVWP